MVRAYQAAEIPTNTLATENLDGVEPAKAILLISARCKAPISFNEELLMKTAVMTGTTGQDGAYLSELLLGKGYKVYGQPAETFESGIRKTVQWYLANPEWVAHVQSGAYREWVQTQYSEQHAA